MATKITRWSPDNCNCVIEYTWDDKTDENTRVHTFSKVVVGCPDHNGLVGEEWLTTMTDESVRNQKVKNYLLNNFSKLAYDFTDERGKQVKNFRHDVAVSTFWSGKDKTRVLHVQISGIPLLSAEKLTLQTFADNNLGAGKVVVE